MFFQDVEAADWAIMGRNTHLAADKPNRRRIVFSSQISGWQRPTQLWLDPSDTTPHALADLISGVHRLNAGLILGGTRVHDWFLEHRAIDAVHLTIEPVAFGDGLPVFSAQTSQDPIEVFQLAGFEVQSKVSLNKASTRNQEMVPSGEDKRPGKRRCDWRRAAKFGKIGSCHSTIGRKCQTLNQRPNRRSNTMKRILILALLAATPASAFIADNKLVVRDTGGGSFEVAYRGLSGARQFWCAAGEYVIRELGQPVTTKIYRTSSPPRRAGNGISFSLSPEGAKGTGLLVWGNPKGISASFARSLCDLDNIKLD